MSDCVRVSHLFAFELRFVIKEVVANGNDDDGLREWV